MNQNQNVTPLFTPQCKWRSNCDRTIHITIGLLNMYLKRGRGEYLWDREQMLGSLIVCRPPFGLPVDDKLLEPVASVLHPQSAARDHTDSPVNFPPTFQASAHAAQKELGAKGERVVLGLGEAKVADSVSFYEEVFEKWIQNVSCTRKSWTN